MSAAENRRLLSAMLSDRYEVVTEFEALNPETPDGPFDLCVVDGIALQRCRSALGAERKRREPLFLPVLVLSDRRDLGLIPRDLWDVADDVILRPVERSELAARLQTLLRTRHLSLRLHRLSMKYEAERRITSRFQEAALPRKLPRIGGVILDSYYRAGQDEARVGGDWYDALRLADGRIVMTVGDVVGSGLDAAVTMASMRQVLRGVAQIHPDPAMMLDAADRALQADDPERIVTAFVAVLDPVTSELRYASAGHPRPLLRRGSTWTELAAPGLPLGVPNKGSRVGELVTMPEDAMLVLYTDGLIEATRDLATGEARLLAALDDPAVVGAPDVARAIHDAVIVGEAHDDIAIFALRRVPTEARAAIARWTFDAADPLAAATVRHEVANRLIEHGLNSEARGSAELVFAELLGNVVRYAPGTVEIALDRSGPAPVLHVLDRGRGFRHLPKLPDDVLSERGRGLYIVSALTDEFTITRRPDGGSHARAVLALSPLPITPFEALVAFDDIDSLTLER